MIKIITDEKGTRVWRKDKEWNGQTFATYSISISKKTDDGYSNAYMEVRFKKGVELQNGTDIVIKNAFPTFTESNGKKYQYIMVTDFEYLNANEGFENIPDGVDEDLPFAAPTR